MYLKAIEIQGFKSFPDRLRLSFEERVVAIVGPNGSGKSNISDAISWVMGEQRSKALRGAKMEDVIFGGTTARGAAGFAQVSLVLGNEDRSLKQDTDEVLITRRYYRSGESEYYINKQLVRLKDVNELLMDTGLGRDGYSLIGQGRVDEILSAKSTERREIFEEAAGISKYRYKKEDTERKLEKTGESLLRVGDKIAELELQVEPLRRQSEQAKKYLLLRDELRGLEITLWMEQLDKLADRTRALRQEYDETGGLLEAEKAALEALYQDAETYSQGIREADQQAEALRADIAQREGAAAALESEAAAKSAEEKSNEASVRRLEEEQSRQAERVLELGEKLRERRQRAVALEGELGALEVRRAALFSDSTAAATAAEDADAALNRLLASAVAAESAAAAEEARVEALGASDEARAAQQAAAEEEIDRLTQRLAAEEAARADAETRLADRREAAQAAENAGRGYGLRVRSRQQKVEETGEALRRLRLDESARRARISLLADMEKEYEGFSRAVRIVMRESGRGSLKNIHGTLADLIHTEDRYAVAVETALGAGLQSIVVDREEDGKAAINLLKRQDGGRATFLPLSAIRGTELSDRELERTPGVEGVASRLVSYDGRYRDIILNQLGRTVVARDMDVAIAVSRRNGGRLRIVTLDGQLINAGGSMTGGSASRNVGVLSRANELTRLTAEAAEAAAQAETLQKDLNALEKELAAAKYEAESAALTLRSAQDAVLQLEAETTQRQALTEAVRQSLAQAEAAAAAAAADSARQQTAAKAAAEAAEAHRTRAAALRAEAESGGHDRQALAEALRALEAESAALNAREASLKTERSALFSAIDEWEALLTSYQGDQHSRDALRASLLEKNAALAAEAGALRRRAEAARAEAGERKPRLEAALQARQAYEGRRTRAEKETQERNRRINELERQYAELGQRKVSADLEEKQLVDKLWDNYELSRSAADRLRQPLESSAKAQKRVTQIRRELSSMGSPNLGAIEEFQRVNERYTFLTSQRDDIEKAKTELLGVVEELTGEMERIFAAEFQAVADSFKETFTELFGGGRAELLLEDPGDILNCGIEIRVQPPGKTLKTLTLLSGGERAFVAIALYFAMLKVRPAPFCVLDEIESALDEANVSRFAQYTRRMSDRTQFLIITHRRGTMEEADMLYGVTMQKGVSRVISVALAEALKTT